MSEQPLPAPKPDDQPIEAGEVGEIKELPFHEAQHRAETARSLATWLVGLQSWRIRVTVSRARLLAAPLSAKDCRSRPLVTCSSTGQKL